MAKIRQVISITPTRKATSQGVGGRGRRIKCSTSTMNKHKREVTKNIEDKVDDNNVNSYY